MDSATPLTVRQRYLVGKHRGLAYELAFRYWNSHDCVYLAGTQEDYVQEALIGMMKAGFCGQ